MSLFVIDKKSYKSELFIDPGNFALNRNEKTSSMLLYTVLPSPIKFAIKSTLASNCV